MLPNPPKRRVKQAVPSKYSRLPRLSCGPRESVKHGNSPNKVSGVNIISPATHEQMKPNISKCLLEAREPKQPLRLSFPS